jgi:lysophospholipase L1-like esterase
MGVEVSVNTLGFRGPETTRAKPAGIRRVLLIGDSTVYGHGVAQEATFASRLNESLGPMIEVINLGVPGYSTEQSINLLELRGWSLEPDLLVVASLWSDNNFDAFIDKDLLSERSAFEHSAAAGVSRVLQRSALYRWLDWHLRLGPKAEAVKNVGWMLGRQPTGGFRRVAVNDYGANLQRLVDLAASAGAQTAFVALANSADLGAPTEGAIAWPLYREVMTDVALRNGAPLLDVQTVFEADGAPWGDLFLDEMHPTERGHALIASALQDQLIPWVEHQDFGLTPTASTPPVWDDPFARGEGPPTDHPSLAAVTLSGSVIGVPEGMPIQIDLIDLGPDSAPGDNPMVGSARFDHVDPFEMPAPRGGAFGIRIYLDKAADGPSAGDPVHEFFDTPIEATGSSLTGIVIDLSNDTIRWASEPPTSPGLLPSWNEAP